MTFLYYSTGIPLAFMIGSGVLIAFMVTARPAPRWGPYTTPLKGLYVCSSATPPGPGVHGLGGLHAARRVLRSGSASCTTFRYCCSCTRGTYGLGRQECPGGNGQC